MNREQWVKRQKRLVANIPPVKTKDLPVLWKMMQEDGITIKVSAGSYQFYLGEYEIQNRSIMNVWYLSPSAMSRLVNWLLEGHYA